MQTQQLIGILAGVLTSTSMIPQLIKLVKEKKAEAISPIMLVVLISGVSLWVVYGCLRQDWPIIVTNAFSLLLNVALLIIRQYYHRQHRRH